MEAEPSVAGPVRYPDRPIRMAAPPLAGLQDYHEAADRLMSPVASTAKASTGAAEPKVTLAGPALPRELMSLQAAGLVPLGRTRRNASSSSGYGWKARSAVVAILLTAGVAAVFRVMPGASANVAVKPLPEASPRSACRGAAFRTPWLAWWKSPAFASWK